MSAPVYNVSVDGNSNDSNVILGSTNGSIVEDDNHDHVNLTNKLAVLENALNTNIDDITELQNQNEYDSQKYKPGTQEAVDELVKTIYDDAVANNKNPYFPLAYGVGSEKTGGDNVISFEGKHDYATPKRSWGPNNVPIQYIQSSSKLITNTHNLYLQDQGLIDVRADVLDSLAGNTTSKLYPYFFESDGTKKPLYHIDQTAGKEPNVIFEGDDDLTQEEQANYSDSITVPADIAEEIDYYAYALLYSVPYGGTQPKRMTKIYFNKKENTNRLNIASFMVYSSGIFTWAYGDFFREKFSKGAFAEKVQRNSTGQELPDTRKRTFVGMGFGSVGGSSAGPDGKPLFLRKDLGHIITYLINRQVCIDAGFYSDQLRVDENGLYLTEDIEALNLIHGQGGQQIMAANAYEAVLKVLGGRITTYDPGTVHQYDAAWGQCAFIEYFMNAALGNTGDPGPSNVNWKYLSNEMKNFYELIGANDTYTNVPNLTEAQEKAGRFHLAITRNIDETGNVTYPNYVAQESRDENHGGINWNNYGNDGKVNVATTVYEHKLHELLTSGNGYIPTLPCIPSPTWLTFTSVVDMTKIFQFINSGLDKDGNQIVKPDTLSMWKSGDFRSLGYDTFNPDNYSVNSWNLTHNGFGGLSLDGTIGDREGYSQGLTSTEGGSNWGGGNSTSWSINVNTGRYRVIWRDIIDTPGSAQTRPEAAVESLLLNKSNFSERELREAPQDQFANKYEIHKFNQLQIQSNIDKQITPTLNTHFGLVSKNIESIYEIYNKIVVLETKLNDSNIFDQWKLDPYLLGEWQLDPKEGSLNVGPLDNPGAWWSIGLADISNRSVLYDDIYKFNAEGTFQNILGEQTWLEGFQLGYQGEAPGTPVAPHDGSKMGTWSVYNDKIYIFGKGSYLGIPKIVNNAELGPNNVPNAIPDKVIYNIISKSLDNNYKYLELGINLFNQFTWRFKFRQESNRKVLFNEPFGGTIYDVTSNTHIHPSSGAESWGGFNNTNKSIYPLIFTSDGEIRFNATVSEDVNIKFRFEKNPYPDVNPAYDTSNILLTPGETSYNVVIPSQGNNTFSSLILYIVDKDKEVILDNIYIYDDSIDYVEPAEPEPDLDLKMTPFGETFNFYPEIYGEGVTYIFSSIAESWGGFGNSNTEVYPFIFSNPGKITFDAALIDKEKGDGTKWNANDTPVNIKFKFEKNPFPDTEPSYTTENITISSYDLTSFSIDIPSQGTNTFSSFLLYLIERDLPIKLTNLKVFHDNNPAEPEIPPSPTPTDSSNNVISIFSDVYDNLVGTEFNPNWGQTTQVTVDNILTYSNLNYQGTNFAATDVSQYEYFHVDFYTTDATILKIFVIKTGGDEIGYDLTNQIVLNSWVSVNIPLSAYESVVDLTGINQLKVEGNGNVLLDNLYFGKSI